MVEDLGRTLQMRLVYASTELIARLECLVHLIYSETLARKGITVLLEQVIQFRVPLELILALQEFTMYRSVKIPQQDSIASLVRLQLQAYAIRVTTVLRNLVRIIKFLVLPEHIVQNTVVELRPIAPLALPVGIVRLRLSCQRYAPRATTAPREFKYLNLAHRERLVTPQD